MGRHAAHVRSRKLGGERVEKDAQESDDAKEKESETAEVGESTQCEHRAGIVENIPPWIRSVKIIVSLWLVYVPI